MTLLVPRVHVPRYGVLSTWRGWVRAGRAVTANHVLRRADVPAAGRVLGAEVPDRVRGAADVPALHWPWLATLVEASKRGRVEADHVV